MLLLRHDTFFFAAAVAERLRGAAAQLTPDAIFA